MTEIFSYFYIQVKHLFYSKCNFHRGATSPLISSACFSVMLGKRKILKAFLRGVVKTYTGEKLNYSYSLEFS